MWPVPEGLGGMLCVLVVPSGNISPTEAGLALSPPDSPISILPSVNKSSLATLPFLVIFFFSEGVAGGDHQKLLI